MFQIARDGSSKKKIFICSLIFMGLSHLIFLKQYVKGAFFALIEIFVILVSPQIVRTIINMFTLGAPQPGVPIKQKDNSMFMLIDGIIILAVVLVFIILYFISVKSAKSTYRDYCLFGSLLKNDQALSSLGAKAFPIFGLAPLILLVLFFVVVPLVFSAGVAFTNYSSPGHIPPNNTVDWVGLDNFKSLFGGDAKWSGAFGRVAAWTLLWAAAATATCYAGGLLMAVIMQESKIKIAPVMRAVFILPYAVPAVVTMLVWQNLLNGSFGVVNRTLIELGLITKETIIPWLSDATMAKFTVVLINLWAGFPYFMLLTMGTMTSIPKEIFEASKIDGSTRFQTFKSITLPSVLYQTMPLIIMSFTFNINNFGAIFFLTGGKPEMADSVTTSAKGTDILVTWIYNLTINLQNYKFAAVLAVCIFIALAPFAIFNFRRTKSFKDGEF
jgi:arabinogalactan oligomer/maltooligosaccharide transport system permease protein